MRRPPNELIYFARSLTAPLEKAVVPRLRLPSVARTAAIPPTVVFCVGRTKYSSLLRGLREQARDAGADFWLWALDGPIAGLEDVTLGEGPGSRTDLQDQLYAKADVPDDAYVVLIDDDIEFVIGSLADLLRLSVGGGFAVTQPAHSRASITSYDWVLGKNRLVARRCSIVEAGPVVVIAPTFLDRILPNPVDFGMGWGLSLRWRQLSHPGEHFGVIDTVRIRHHGKIGVEYPHGIEPEAARARQVRAESGLPAGVSVYEMYEVWERGDEAPPWLASSPA